MEYLYSQTGCALEDYKHIMAAMETQEMAVAEDEGYVEPVLEFEDLTVP